jgi:hypothetical protein
MSAIYNQGETSWKRNVEILGKIAKEVGTNAGQLLATYGTVDAALAACRRSTGNLGEAYRKVADQESKRANVVLPNMEKSLINVNKAQKENLDLYNRVMADTSDPFVRAAPAIENVTYSLTDLNTALLETGLMTEDVAKNKAMELVDRFQTLKQAGIDESLILNVLKEDILQLSQYLDAFGIKAPEAFNKLLEASKKALPSFRQFLAEGKVGDLSHLDTSKQNEEIAPPSAELDDYDFGMPEKSPGISLKGFMGSWWGDLKKGLDEQFGGIVDSFKAGGIGGALGGLIGFGAEGKGGIFGALGSMFGPQEGILGTMQQFASMIPGIGTMISNIIGGIGTAFNALKSLFGGLRRDIKGLIKYVCYRNYTNFLYKQNVVSLW